MSSILQDSLNPQIVYAAPQGAASLGTDNAGSHLTYGGDAHWGAGAGCHISDWDTGIPPLPYDPMPLSVGRGQPLAHTQTNTSSIIKMLPFSLILNQNRLVPSGHIFSHSYTAE